MVAYTNSIHPCTRNVSIKKTTHSRYRKQDMEFVCNIMIAPKNSVIAPARMGTIPEYSVEVKSVTDIQIVFHFANKNNIAVVVKTLGHSYSGSSMGKGTILIWMYYFEKFGDIKTNFTDSCGTVYPHTIKVGGGQTWGEVYNVLRFSHCGWRWFNGLSRWWLADGLWSIGNVTLFGIGIDNVLNFEVVLTNGSHVYVDACSHPDLFWGLRGGGGGGTFGVVTSVHYRLRPAENIVFTTLEITNIAQFVTTTVDSWIDEWVDISPHLDKRWGGYWFLNGYLLYFLGNMDEAESTFLNKVKTWKENLPLGEVSAVKTSATSFKSYYDSRGGPAMTTDKTGQLKFNIANRLIPKDWVVNNPQEAKETLKWMVRNGFFTFNYFLGGVMGDVDGNETAVHPAMRKAIWQIETFDERMTQKLREVIPDTGAGYNHAAKDEPDWQKAFWGSNLNRLKSLKKAYDPSYRLNCWHCVGYGQDEPITPSTTASPTTSAAPITTVISTTPKQGVDDSSGNVNSMSAILVIAVSFVILYSNVF